MVHQLSPSPLPTASLGTACPSRPSSRRWPTGRAPSRRRRRLRGPGEAAQSRPTSPSADADGVRLDTPAVPAHRVILVLAYTGNEDAKKFFFSGEITLDSIKEFAQDFLEDKLTPFYKSDPVPESNDEDVKVVVGKSVDQIVLDESKDVLLEVLNLLMHMDMMTL
ncbi:protein disulfide-isomerase-like [Hordeum vulgare subsp. vulgare]|uniref:protein disulfide-isomerase-like n=1 Tax=Hordeum vulgare subsp. vulgare TaxID=112509 RepID=UPI001D1A5657|nr:protein disulfide-isomerase-like [Hordeum vulgare subsp. vulgare]